MSDGFYSGGHIGDAIYQLYTLSKTPAKSVFFLGPGQDNRWGSEEIKSIIPLAKYQSYISSCEEVDSCPEGAFNFKEEGGEKKPECFYELSMGWPGDLRLKKLYFVSYFKDMGMRWILENFKRSGAWLTAPSTKKFDVVAHIPTRRITRSKKEWVHIIKAIENSGRTVAIIGGEDVREWDGHFNCIKPKDMLDAADYINSSRMFIGSASCNYVIAEGLDKLRFVDIHPDSLGTAPSEDNGWNITPWSTQTCIERILDCI